VDQNQIQGSNLKVLLISGALLILVALILAWVAVSGVGEGISSGRQTSSEATENTENVAVDRVIDGDTIVLNDGRRVRYIGINTPELGSGDKKGQCFSLEAKAANEKLVMGKKIRLEKDMSGRDKYGRLLRYVYVEDEDGQEVFVNDYLVSQGYAKFLSIPPDIKFEGKFVGSADEAKFQNRGLWAACN
jgi:micrococcal nuclease